MSRPIRPGRDPTIASMAGATRDGQPLSYNRAPAADLAPWVGRIYVTKVAAPNDHVLQCGLLNDTALLRVQLRGEWVADTASGRITKGNSALFFGPQSRRMPITVTGPFISAGLAFNPGACHALRGPKIGEWLDRLTPLDTFGGDSARWLSRFDPDASPEEWCLAIEDGVRQMVEQAGGGEPDPVSRRFEAVAHVDPTISVARFADDCGIEQRRLERIVRRDFGLPPKQVLRRARALDMASHLRGVADQDEAEELALRYYDQSHLIRDFAHYFGMSPRQFVEMPQPLMTLSLETRQARRLEMIERLAPGEVRPWE